MKHFRAFLYGPKPFEVLSDHSSLKYLPNIKDKNSMVMRMAQELSEYEMIFSFRPGAQNQLSDALSRRPFVANAPPVEEERPSLLSNDSFPLEHRIQVEAIVHREPENEQVVSAVQVEEPIDKSFWRG